MFCGDQTRPLGTVPFRRKGHAEELTGKGGWIKDKLTRPRQDRRTRQLIGRRLTKSSRDVIQFLSGT